MIQQNAENLASVLFPLTLVCRYCGRRTDAFLSLCAVFKKKKSLNTECWLSHFQTSETYCELSKLSVVGNWSVTTHEDKPHLCSLKPSVWSCSELIHFCFPSLEVAQDIRQVSIVRVPILKVLSLLSNYIWEVFISHVLCDVAACPTLHDSNSWNFHLTSGSWCMLSSYLGLLYGFL